MAARAGITMREAASDFMELLAKAVLGGVAVALVLSAAILVLSGPVHAVGGADTPLYRPTENLRDDADPDHGPGSTAPMSRAGNAAAGMGALWAGNLSPRRGSSQHDEAGA